MLRGVVCQLHYNGGGSLRCLRSSGDAFHVPFFTASHGLRVGQSAHFSLDQSRGQDEAVDLQVEVPDEVGAVATSAKVQVLTGDTCQGETSSIISSMQGRKLRLSMAKFHNSDLEEQLEMLAQAEELLDRLLKTTDTDADALCKLVNRLAAWLHAPRSRAGSTAVAIGEGSDHGGTTLQCRIRRLLIKCFKHLDLTDPNTYLQVEAALLHLSQVLGKETPSLHNTASLAVRQSQKLRSLIGISNGRTPTLRRRPVTGSETSRPRSKMKHEERSSSVNGIYRPNFKVRNLPSVSASEEVAVLKCQNCKQTISSSWFWCHPRSEKRYVMVPALGHSSCSKQLGRRCPWRSVGDSPTVLDDFNHLDFCHHKRRRAACGQCEGKDLCAHKRQMSRCDLCRAKRQKTTLET